MVTLRLDDLLGDRSYYWLAQETGIAYSTIRRLASPKSERIYYTTLDKLCDALECTPGDCWQGSQFQNANGLERLRATLRRLSDQVNSSKY
ncbi:MAG TPA: helix-turn-helix transcriptional regulator [Pyrinomonadaceae bacterium]